MRSTVILAAALLAGCASSETTPNSNATDAQMAFARLKLLVGHWNGKLAGQPETAPAPESTPPQPPTQETPPQQPPTSETTPPQPTQETTPPPPPAPEPTAATIPVEYAVVSGGHELRERLFAGTKDEIVTSYYLEGEGLALVRYASIGFRPHMRLDVARSTRDDLRFECDETATDLELRKDSYIRRGRIHFVDADTIECEWTFWADGKESHTSEITLSRASGGFTPLPK